MAKKMVQDLIPGKRSDTAEQEYLSGILYVVGTPIGNLGDASNRLIETLTRVDGIYAEDTRRSGKLLELLGVSSNRRLKSLHRHNEEGRIAEVIERLNKGDALALISDAGMPGISDPGMLIVSAVHKAGLKVAVIPGASSVTSVMALSGFSSHHPTLIFGFVPLRGKVRAESITLLLGHQGVAVFLEAPHRVEKTLNELAAVQPEREVCVAREMTKRYEECVRLPLSEAARRYTGKNMGEFTFALGPWQENLSKKEEASAAVASDLSRWVKACQAKGISAKDTAAVLSVVTGERKKTIYRLCLE